MGAGVMESSEVSVGFNAVLSGSGEGSLFPGTMTGFIGRTATEVFFLLSLVLLLKL